MKILSIVFGLFAILLSNIMCAVVAFNYCDMLWRIKYTGFSAPASIAFYYAIPFIIAIIVCIILSKTFFKKVINLRKLESNRK